MQNATNYFGAFDPKLVCQDQSFTSNISTSEVLA